MPRAAMRGATTTQSMPLKNNDTRTHQGKKERRRRLQRPVRARETGFTAQKRTTIPMTAQRTSLKGITNTHTHTGCASGMNLLAYMILSSHDL